MTDAAQIAEMMRAIDAYAFDYQQEGKLCQSRRAVERMLAKFSSRRPLSPADSLPRRPCKECGGTMVGQEEHGQLSMRCVHCKREEAC